MPTSYIRMNVHFVWATWDRQPLIDATWEARLHAALAAQGEEMKCPLFAVNGMADHVHVLLRMLATLTLAEVVQRLKGTTSHLINTEFHPRTLFRWQAAYAAFCVEPENVDRIRTYILNQKSHHAHNTIQSAWETSEE